ncbi:MAG: hypothetical protein WBE68_19905 [Candidatus Nitrosopolaris sp.]
MKIGQQATKENLIQLSKMAEQERIDSLWVGERLLWPLKPQTPYRGTPDGSLPNKGREKLLFRYPNGK